MTTVDHPLCGQEAQDIAEVLADLLDLLAKDGPDHLIDQVRMLEEHETEPVDFAGRDTQRQATLGETS